MLAIIADGVALLGGSAYGVDLHDGRVADME
jgi:hypothetical protein